MVDVETYQPQNVISYSYTHFEDNRPTQWRATLGNVEGFRVDLYSAADEFTAKRLVVQRLKIF